MDSLKSYNELTLRKFIVEDGIEHFTADEILRPVKLHDGVIPVLILDNIRPTLYLVDMVRDTLQFPIRITSSYRSFFHNKAIGGVKNSMHLQFNALDITPAIDRNFHWLEFASQLQEIKRFLLDGAWSFSMAKIPHTTKLLEIRYTSEGIPYFHENTAKYEYRGLTIYSKLTGIGIYKTFIHVDTRGLFGKFTPARWTGSS